MIEGNTVTISLEEYAEMQEQLSWLQCLEDAGIDNWNGIDYAQNMWARKNSDESEG